MELVNILLALLTIAFGAIGLVSPSYAMGALKLQTAGPTDGMSEIRAASGGAFVATGAAALILSHPLGWTLLGAHYAGAALGRIVSIGLDGSGSRKIWAFFLIEAVFAAWLIGANGSGVAL